MKLQLLTVGTLTAFTFSVFGFMGTTSAHPVTVDGYANEWTSLGTGPNEDNMAHVIRNSLGQGEFAWLDVDSDQRIVATTPVSQTREVDMSEVRVTGDAANLSIYVLMGAVTQINPASPDADLPQFQIGIDRSAGGVNTFVAPSSGAPASATTLTAPWEYLIQTDFQNAASSTISLDLLTNTAPPLVYSNATTSAPAGIAAINKNTNVVEIQVPWSAIGGLPTGPVKFTIATLRTKGDLANDGIASNILDTITPTYPGGVTDVRNTQAELQDGRIDYAFEVNFDQPMTTSSATAGEVYSPLLVTEVGLYPKSTSISTSGSSTLQWIEITNVSNAPLSGSQVSTYKIGDAPQRRSNETMRQLPNVDIGAGQSIIIARNKGGFQSVYPGVATGSVYDSGSLAPSTNWASPYMTTTLSLRATGLMTETISDQVVLLDGGDTIADLVEYTNVAPLARPYPDNTPVTVPYTSTVTGGIALLPDISIQRCPSNRDTNNNNDPTNPDWVVVKAKAEQTPLATCQVADVGVTVSGPQSIVTSVTAPVEQTYVISYTNNRLDATSVVITDTLPVGMEYKAGSTVSSPAGLGEPTVSTTLDGRTQLVWSLGTVAGAATGQITFTTALPANTPAGNSSQDVSISTTTRELQSELPNNVFSLPVSYTSEAVVDVAVTQSVVTSGNNASKLYPGGQVVYRINFSNSGSKEAAGITLVDSIPNGLTYLSNSKNFAADTSVAGQVKLTVPNTLAALTGSGTVDVVFAINESLSSGATIAPNTVTIATASTPELTTTNNTASTTAVTLGERPAVADLVVTTQVKDASNAKPGGSIVYTVNYANNGARDAFDVMLANSFSSSLEYQSNSQQLAADLSVPNQVTFALAPLPTGSSGSIDITFKIKSNAVVGAKVTNRATISTSSEEAPVGNNSSISAETEIVRGAFMMYLPTIQR